MHRLQKVLREIHRRTLWQVLGIYLVGSWGALRAVSFVTAVAGLPEWTATLAFVLLLIGLPVVTATSFVQQGVPGLRGEYRDEVDPNELVGLTPEEVHVDPEAHPLYRYRLLTWRNAVLGGVGASALLVASVVAYFGMWAAGIGPMGSLVAQGVLEPGETVVLEAFEDPSGDGLGEAVRAALRVALEDASILGVAAPGGAAGLVLDGAVTPTGTGYVITAELKEAGSGRSLASFRSRAEAMDGMVPAIARLSRDIREKSGESLRRIRSSPPLHEIATPSFEALRLYAGAERAREVGDLPGAAALLERALDRDPDFTLAALRLGGAHEQMGDTTKALEVHRGVVDRGAGNHPRGRRWVEAALERIAALGG